MKVVTWRVLLLQAAAAAACVLLFSTIRDLGWRPQVVGPIVVFAVGSSVIVFHKLRHGEEDGVVPGLLIVTAIAAVVAFVMQLVY